MIMVKEPLTMKEKKRKTISQSTTMATTTAKPVGSNVWTGAVKAQPSATVAAMPSATAATMAAANTTKTWPSSQLPMEATTAKPAGSNGWTGAVKAQPSATATAMTAATAARMLTMAAMASSVPRNTLDESESGVDIASLSDLKSLRAKWDAATTVDSKKKVFETITTENPFRLKYSSEALVELLVLALEMDKINHSEQFIDKARWRVWVNGRGDFHNRANKIHLESSARIKGRIAGALMVNNVNLPQDAVLAEGAFVVENMHMLILKVFGLYPDKKQHFWGWVNHTNNQTKEGWFSKHTPDFLWKTYKKRGKWTGISLINPEINCSFVYSLYQASFTDNAQLTL